MLVFCCLAGIRIYQNCIKTSQIDVKIMTSNPSMNKSTNADFTLRIDNLMPYVNFTRWDRVYMTNMVGIREKWAEIFRRTLEHHTSPGINIACKLKLFYRANTFT